MRFWTWSAERTTWNASRQTEDWEDHFKNFQQQIYWRTASWHRLYVHGSCTQRSRSKNEKSWPACFFWTKMPRKCPSTTWPWIGWTLLKNMISLFWPSWSSSSNSWKASLGKPLYESSRFVTNVVSRYTQCLFARIFCFSPARSLEFDTLLDYLLDQGLESKSRMPSSCLRGEDKNHALIVQYTTSNFFFSGGKGWLKVNSRYRFAFLLQGKHLHDHVLTIRYKVEIRGTKKTHLTYSKGYKSALLSILLLPWSFAITI